MLFMDNNETNNDKNKDKEMKSQNNDGILSLSLSLSISFLSSIQIEEKSQLYGKGPFVRIEVLQQQLEG